ncbi:MULTISPECIES: XRE family transcriptional regulator [Arthrobacter]|uniref:XRE family transcriptional regulator n=2 Tax=Arthrobacter TaxID=1663 RepID=A0ABU9KMQ5_9MICC|nr:XRE family transcriptional regulator [Arthrobacter sp. YJM1]MDP5228202.1 XRE family transcriptional regulator [Arthrobacter sp. YJM1]
MSTDADLLAATIGARVKHERQARGWTLDQLSDAAGVSRRMVVNVEQGAANPSIATLLRLSDALGVGLPALVEPPHTHGGKVTRRGDGAVLWTGEHGGRGVLVAGTASLDVVELWDWTLEAGDSLSSEPHAPGTKELLQVLSGQLTVTVAGEPFTLGAGDALSFSGDVEHSYANPGQDTTRFSLSVFEPGVGAGHLNPAHRTVAP